MRHFLAIALAVFAVPLATTSFGQDSTQIKDPTIVGLVKVADSVKLPAKEPGVLVQLAVKDGAIVKAGQVIGKIDDSEPQMQKEAATAAYKAAYRKWQDDVEIRFAKKQAEYSKARLDLMKESNRITEKAVTLVELNEAKLEYEKNMLGIEKSGHDQELAKYEAKTKETELTAAEQAIQRRVIRAPFDGVVEEVKKHQDEWVQPGDTILDLLHLDTMYVEGGVDPSQFDRKEIANCEVTVEVEMARGRKASFRGRIINVSSALRYDNKFNVRAEIANQQEQGNWLLHDKMPASLTIHVGTGTTPASAQRPK